MLDSTIFSSNIQWKIRFCCFGTATQGEAKTPAIKNAMCVLFLYIWRAAWFLFFLSCPLNRLGINICYRGNLEKKGSLTNWF